MNITWKYTSSVSDELIKSVEETFGISIPLSLRKVIKEGNNGYPSKNKFDAKQSKEHLFKTLLSYYKNDLENVFVAFASLKESNTVGMIPFANDPAGNLICLKDSRVVLWNHETCSIEEVSDSIEDFFNSLY